MNIGGAWNRGPKELGSRYCNSINVKFIDAVCSNLRHSVLRGTAAFFAVRKLIAFTVRICLSNSSDTSYISVNFD